MQLKDLIKALCFRETSFSIWKMEYSEENKTESTKEHWNSILIKGKRKKVELFGCILLFFVQWDV